MTAVGPGRLPDGRPVTEELVQRLVEEAERGYDIGALRSRRRGRPPLGSGPASVESVRLDAELKSGLVLRAAAEGRSVSEVIRDAVRQYLASA